MHTRRQGGGAPLWSRFRTALAEDGLTLRAWSDARGWSRTHVREVADGRRESPDLREAIVAYTVDVEARMRRRLGAA